MPIRAQVVTIQPARRGPQSRPLRPAARAVPWRRRPTMVGRACEFRGGFGKPTRPSPSLPGSVFDSTSGSSEPLLQPDQWFQSQRGSTSSVRNRRPPEPASYINGGFADSRRPVACRQAPRHRPRIVPRQSAPKGMPFRPRGFGSAGDDDVRGWRIRCQRRPADGAPGLPPPGLA
jgi:hypothetical protein